MKYKEFRQPSYGYARRLQSKFPSSWIDKKISAIVWLLSFVKRHKNTASQSENTNLSSTTALNKQILKEFSYNYERAIKSWNFIAGRMYYNDETGLSRECCLLILLRRLGNQADDCCTNWKLGVG